jgi:Cys-tRNA(Pro) deacylase
MDTEVTLFLDSRGIEYRRLPHANPAYTCEAAAEERKVPLNEMIKSILLVDRKKNYYLVGIPADRMVDTKKVRNMLDSTRLSFASKEEIEEVSGYVMGAVPPLLLKTDIPVLFDHHIREVDRVNISSGDPRLGLELNSEDLVVLINPTFGDLIK